MMTDAAFYYDGKSSHKHKVELVFSNSLRLVENGTVIANWQFRDLRENDCTAGRLRFRSLSAPEVSSVSISDPALITLVRRHALNFHDDVKARAGSLLKIIGISMGAAASVILVATLGIPKLAKLITPMVPLQLEDRMGVSAQAQVKAFFGGKECVRDEGTQALLSLANTLTTQSGIQRKITINVLDTSIPNAIALPGGQIYLFRGLLDKAESIDEIAGVLGHEIGHQANRDMVRSMIESSGSAFLLGLLFGDVTGSSTVIFASRQVIDSSHSREAETGADLYGTALMHKLNRPAAPMARLLKRLDGSNASRGSIFSSHPITNERLARLEAADAAAGKTLKGNDILASKEWTALKNICKTERQIKEEANPPEKNMPRDQGKNPPSGAVKQRGKTQR